MSKLPVKKLKHLDLELLSNYNVNKILLDVIENSLDLSEVPDVNFLHGLIFGLLMANEVHTSSQFNPQSTINHLLYIFVNKIKEQEKDVDEFSNFEEFEI